MSFMLRFRPGGETKDGRDGGTGGGEGGLRAKEVCVRL